MVAGMQNEIALVMGVSARREAARAYLWREMNARGLFEHDGWRILETTRDMAGRTELVLRPVHTFLPSPEGLECIVEIHEDSFVDSHCEPASEQGATSA
jgi:hypothetical protein